MDMTGPTGDDLVTTVGRLMEVSSALDRHLGRSLEERCGISHSWFEVLLRVSREPDGRMSMGALAEQIVLTSGGVTRLVDRILVAGYLQRLPCTADRRVSYAAITPEGREKLQEALEVHVDNLQGVFAGFSRDDLGKLDRLLDRMRPRLGAQRSP